MNLFKSFNSTKLLDFSLDKTLLKRWNAISPCSKHAFLWMFGIINVVFLWHTVTFFFGNHVWGHIKQGIPVGWSVWDGRWGAGLIQQAVGGDILPVLNNLFCFAGFCFAMIPLAKYWRIPKNTLIYVVFGLFIMLMPYTYPWLQFVRSEPHFWNMCIIIVGLILLESSRAGVWLISVPLFVFSLGCYAAIIEAITSVFLAKCLLDVFFNYTDFKNFIEKHYKAFISIILSFIIYVIISALLNRYHYIMSMATTSVANLDVIFNNIIRLPQTLKATFVNALPYISSTFKLFLVSGLALSLIFLKNKKILEVILILMITMALVLTSQITQILSVDNYYNQLRLDFFCMPYIYAVGWVILLKQKREFWKSLALFMMILATCYSGLQAFRDQKVKYFDLQRDMKIFDDIRSRIKANPNFSDQKQYHLLILGEVDSNFKLTPFDHYNQDLPWQDAWAPFVPNWNAKDFFDFYEKESFIKVSYADCCLPLPDEHLKTMDIGYLMNRAAPWPNLNGVHVDNENIYIIFSQEELNKLRERIKLLESNK